MRLSSDDGQLLSLSPTAVNHLTSSSSAVLEHHHPVVAVSRTIMVVSMRIKIAPLDPSKRVFIHPLGDILPEIPQ